ncbi:MAG TPA: hypothetical protein VMN35_04675 [Gaiellaceae bacterium]|nr:hypothetical protein [Gaiellaceae bacterium]
MRRLAVAVALAALASQVAWPSAGAQQASRVIDRTYSCPVGERAGVRKVEVRANTGTPLFENPAQWKFLASAYVGDSTGSLGHVAAGNPKAPENGFRFPPERLSIPLGRGCRAEARIPLSSANLTGGRASQIFDAWDCVPGGRVVVRLRALFRAPTTLRRKTYVGGQRFLVAAGTVQHGFLAVRSRAGRPLAYADVLANGRGRLFVAGACTPG